MRTGRLSLCVPSAVLLTFWSFGAASAPAIKPSGTTLAVIQATDADGTGGRRMLAMDAPVFMGDRVKTGASGEAQIRFRDDTKLVVGPGSSLLIDKFVFDAGGAPKAVSINAVRGTFRFISGLGPKSAYTIRTPTATLGLRGTHFDLTVERNGRTTLALYEGGLRFCMKAGKCYDLKGRCDVVVADPKGHLRRIEADFERATLIENTFPYFRSQRRLLRPFRVDTSSCTVQRAQLGLTAPTFATPPGQPPGPPGPPGPPSLLGNPGNDKGVGHAGETPGPGVWGGGTQGKGDTGNGPGGAASASASAAGVGAAGGNGGNGGAGGNGGSGGAGGNGGGNGGAGGNGGGGGNGGA
jgi:hypothetical protein